MMATPQCFQCMHTASVDRPYRDVESERDRPQPAAVRGRSVADDRDPLRPATVGHHRAPLPASVHLGS